MKAKSITRTVAAFAVATAGAVAAAPPVSWRPAPDYEQLFAPTGQRDVYRAAVTAVSLDQVAAELRSDATLAAWPEAWDIRDESPLDAFGTAGPYNRWQAARAYGSRNARVARGVRLDRGRVVEAWTLVSPYPSTDLRRLQEGTLRLVRTIAP